MVEKSSLNKNIKKELSYIYHNYELLLCINDIHTTRFDYSAAVISEDWIEVMSHCKMIQDKLQQSHLLSTANQADKINKDDIILTSSIIEEEHVCMALRGTMFYNKEEMITKGTLILDHINSILAEQAVHSIQNLDLLPELEALIFIQKQLKTILDFEGSVDRNKFYLPLAMKKMYIYDIPRTRLLSSTDAEDVKSKSVKKARKSSTDSSTSSSIAQQNDSFYISSKVVTRTSTQSTQSSHYSQCHG
jgi:hypothetical protein